MIQKIKFTQFFISASVAIFQDIKFGTANFYYNKQLQKMAKSKCDIGNMGDIITKDVSRKIKYESNRRFDRDKDTLVDLFFVAKR